MLSPLCPFEWQLDVVLARLYCAFVHLCCLVALATHSLDQYSAVLDYAGSMHCAVAVATTSVCLAQAEHSRVLVLVLVLVFVVVRVADYALLPEL